MPEPMYLIEKRPRDASSKWEPIFRTRDAYALSVASLDKDSPIPVKLSQDKTNVYRSVMMKQEGQSQSTNVGNAWLYIDGKYTRLPPFGASHHVYVADSKTEDFGIARDMWYKDHGISVDINTQGDLPSQSDYSRTPTKRQFFSNSKRKKPITFGRGTGKSVKTPQGKSTGIGRGWHKQSQRHSKASIKGWKNRR